MKRKILTISLIVGISILLWVFVSFSGEFSITLNLPIAITELPEETAISSISADEVTINLKGTGWQLAQHTFGRDQKFYLQGPQKIGVQKLSPLSALNANDWLSSTLQLTKIIPEEISVEVEKNIIKKVKVISNLNLSYKPNYDLVSKIIVSPDSVLISGPKSLVDKILFVKTVNDNYSNLEKKMSSLLKLQKQEFIILEHDECNVEFDVQKIVDKTFDKIKVVTRNVPPRYDVVLSPSTVKIVIRGGINLLSKLKSNDIKAYVNFSQAINDTSGAVEPKIELPDFTNIIDQNPRSIDYIIKKY
ncbi:MAG: CdaR family protein [Melioribacteraceae bacterium]